ncbi:hypothetical protein [Streptomyces albicerus]|uniref:hypothetical protein n=1 Tax=Streptomyces albicerus TaxID=2569859 RepID=UPI001CEDB069|nr:hypothetical protein [Streptomyces albicerus]
MLSGAPPHDPTKHEGAVVVPVIAFISRRLPLTPAGTWGVGALGGKGANVLQSSNCTSHDLNVDVLGPVGVLNGVLGNALNGEGNSGG